MTDDGPRVVLFAAAPEALEREIRSAVPGIDLGVCRTEAELARDLPGAEVLLCTKLPPAALSDATRLRWIQVTSAGIEGLLPVRDRIAALSVTNARGVHVDLMADHAIAVMVMLQWDFPGLLRSQAAGRWDRGPRAPLAGRTLGVLGPGAIGAEIGRRAAAFGMRVIGVSRSGAPLPGFDAVHPVAGLHSVLPDCDFVCVVVPATPETRHMIGARELGLMKRTAFLLNVSRGSLVDEAALIAALRAGEIAGAGLDVFEQEPPAPDNPLWSMPNVIMTPHISGMTTDNAPRVAALFAENLGRFRAGETLRNLVRLDRGY